MKVSNSAERLKEIMQIYGLKQAELVKITGIQKAVMSRYISGQREPRQDNIMAISLAFNLDPAWLMGYDVPMHKKQENNVDYIYSTEVGEILVEVQNKPNVLEILKLYMQLTDENRGMVDYLIKTMIRNQNAETEDKK